jgi:hypothetical protein
MRAFVRVDSAAAWLQDRSDRQDARRRKIGRAHSIKARDEFTKAALKFAFAQPSGQIEPGAREKAPCHFSELAGNNPPISETS